ncbi:MAG: hypothetical protein QF745_05600 [Planctomycetota bacterium]|nr:hypothetical protein [Planctomycetota bacterium]
MTSRILFRTVALTALTLVAACFNSDENDNVNGADNNATSTSMLIVEVTNGFGRMLPHLVHKVNPDGSISTDQLVEIRDLDTLLANTPSALNPVLPPAAWPTSAIIPSGQNGNHFVSVKFSRTLETDSVLDPSAGGLSNNGLTGAVQVVAYDPSTGLSTQLDGQGFVGGSTYNGNPPVLEQWVSQDGFNHVLVDTVDRNGILVQPGVGYPGTDIGVLSGSFPAAGDLVRGNVFTFVMDADNDLSTFETFPEDVVIRVVIDDSVLSWDSRQLVDPGVATSTVGNDITPPAVLLDGDGGDFVTQPVNYAINVSCDQEVHFHMDESCQPYSLGPLPATVPPALSSEFTVEFLPGVPPGFPQPGQKVKVPYTVMPVSPFDFTEFIVTPVVPFPGSDPQGSAAQAFITYFDNSAEDLFFNNDTNSLETVEIEFEVDGECPGIVNAPVAPGAIYIASNGGGETGGMRVLDLDGFGQGTGDPTHNEIDPFYDLGDISKFPFNPNLTSPQGSFMFPPLSHDNTTLAGGSAGVFTLAKDSRLSTQLMTSESLGTVADMMIGHPLDLLFNNWDCLSGGQNLCASSAFQIHPYNGNIIYPGNSISHAPHPNPPRIRLAPSCFAPLIMTEEPTFGDAGGGHAVNLLVPGNPFGTIGGAGPTGLLTTMLTYAGFYGPQATSSSCYAGTAAVGFTLRQKVGHMLYVLDSAGNRIVVVNSNRMVVMDTISVPDPRDLAMAPDMNLLAVSNGGTNSVTFIDTNPTSPNFHTVVHSTSLVDTVNNRVGIGPGEIVWQPDDEDVLVVCEASNSMALISTGDLEVRKIIPGVAQPRLIAVTNRDTALHPFWTGLYFAFVISEDGQTTIFESGPDGIQGIGFDTFIGVPSLIGQSGFESAMVIQPNSNSMQHGVYIAYRKDAKASVAELYLKDAPATPRQTALNGFLPDPSFRTKEFSINREFIGNLSSSTIVDIAMDDLSNFGGFSQVTSMTAGAKTVNHSSKSLYRTLAGAVSKPRFLFVANANGKLDIIELATGNLYVDSISIPGAQVLASYWRQ